MEVIIGKVVRACVLVRISLCMGARMRICIHFLDRVTSRDGVAWFRCRRDQLHLADMKHARDNISGKLTAT